MNSVKQGMKAQNQSKRRYLASWLEHTLCVIAMYCLLPLFMLADFEICWQSFAWIFGRLFLGIVCIMIVAKYGNGLWLEKE